MPVRNPNSFFGLWVSSLSGVSNISLSPPCGRGLSLNHKVNFRLYCHHPRPGRDLALPSKTKNQTHGFVTASVNPPSGLAGDQRRMTGTNRTKCPNVRPCVPVLGSMVQPQHVAHSCHPLFPIPYPRGSQRSPRQSLHSNGTSGHVNPGHKTCTSTECERFTCCKQSGKIRWTGKGSRPLWCRLWLSRESGHWSWASALP